MRKKNQSNFCCHVFNLFSIFFSVSITSICFFKVRVMDKSKSPQFFEESTISLYEALQ